MARLRYPCNGAPPPESHLIPTGPTLDLIVDCNLPILARLLRAAAGLG